ncbi:hypothetical protein RQP54_18190 [Curvibacter sp. APW13]|uniref:hypothetical protein n=1 Tax=Curvibacter sp. APW13 TaxID=3077236 RepID=UPI0028DE14B3|nr:hypothetical protein [Curvibacter sp. APW13]MDT8992809.1 hypothetical protein [Curvibacter sp. APW13]
MQDNPSIAADLIQTVFFDMTNRQFVDLVNPNTKLGVYSHKTLNELAIEYKAEIVEMDRKKAYRLQDEKHITAVEEATGEYFNEMLNVLPPCQWRRDRDFEHFFLSERISGSIVLYLVRAGERYFKFQDRERMESADIRKRIDNYLATTAQMLQAA